MQLLVYARNHTPPGRGEQADCADRFNEGKNFVGLAIGERPQVEMGGDFGGEPTATSFVEVRVPAHTIDLLTAVPLLVAKAIAREPLASHKTITLTSKEGIVRLKLEPGFASAKEVCAPLIPMLERCRVYGDTVTTSMTAAAADAIAAARV